MDDLFDLVLGDQTQILSSGNSDDLPVSLRILVFAQADKGSCFSIDALDGLSTFTDDKPDQPHGDLQFYLM